MTKVCIITSAHPPFDTRIFHKEAISLAKAGYDITLIAQHDKDEIVDGIKIVSLLKPKNRFERMMRTVWQIYWKALEIDAKFYHLHDPELLPLGMLLKVRGCKVIYDIHEDVPRQILSKYWLPGIVRKPVAWAMSSVEWFAAKVFNAMLPTTHKIADRFPAIKTVTIQNYPIVAELLQASPIPYNERPLSFAYAGVIASIRGIVEIVNAFELINDIPGVGLDLAGEFSPPRFEETLRALPGWAAVHYHGQVSRTQVAQIMGNARAGLVLHHPVPNEIDAQPIKMFEYMSVGLPVIASDFPQWRRIIEGARCGLMVDPLNPTAIADAIRWILDHPAEAEAMGQYGRQAVECSYNWDTEATKMIGLYNKLLAS